MASGANDHHLYNSVLSRVISAESLSPRLSSSAKKLRKICSLSRLPDSSITQAQRAVYNKLQVRQCASESDDILAVPNGPARTDGGPRSIHGASTFYTTAEDRSRTTADGWSSRPPVAFPSSNPVVSLEPVLSEIRQIKESQQKLSDNIEAIKNQIQNEYSYFHQALHEEKYRYQKLEDQVNDLIELHQADMNNLKQEIGSMEEKIEYQNVDRLRDLKDMVEQCQTRVSKMEHAQQTQLMGLEELSSSSFNQFGLRCLNILILVLHVTLLIISTIAQIVKPFFSSRVRLLTTVGLIVVLWYMYSNRSLILHPFSSRFDTDSQSETASGATRNI